MGAFRSAMRRWPLTLVSLAIGAGAIGVGTAAGTQTSSGSSAGLARVAALAAPGQTNRVSVPTTLVDMPRISAPADVIVSEGDDFVDLVVSLSAPGDSAVRVNYATANSSAAAGGSCFADYTGVSDVLDFLPGETTKVVRLDLLDCADVEGLQSFTLNLSLPANATLARPSTRIGIVDNDTLVTTPRLFVRDAVVDERDGSARVSVLLGGPGGQRSNSTVTVGYTTSDGTAGAPADYETESGTLTFLPGETAKTVDVEIAEEDTSEPSESFALSLLSNPTNATIADGTGIVVIGASDATAVSQPGVSAPADMVVGEGDGFVDLVVSLSAPGLNPVSVDFDTANSSAAAGASCFGDYIGVSGRLDFVSGETTKVMRVDLLDCVDVEGLQSFTLALSLPENAAIARPSARVGIVDNDTVVATPRLFVRDAVVDERDGSARVTVLMGGPGGKASNSTVTVGYATGDGTASAGADYTAVDGTLTFAPGESAKTVVVAIAEDGNSETPESLALTLSNATNATITDGTGIVVIGASDAAAVPQPGVSAPADVFVDEGDGFVDLVVSLSAPGLSPVAVNFATANSTAAAGASCFGDYIGVSGRLDFVPDETTKVVRVDLLDCVDTEGVQSFTLTLSLPENATIARPTARISIVDNDTAVADFNGDGNTEIGIFRPSTSLWALRGLNWARFGGSGDIPVPGDYDGDADTEIAIFQPSTGLWAINGQDWANFGGPGDIPVPADYDDDGDTDIAVYQPSTGLWAIRGQDWASFGGSAGDIPLPADYNGDGRDDIAIFQPSTGLWAIRGQDWANFGGPGDIPVPADYDGDDIDDIAIYKPGSGLWAIRGQDWAGFGGGAGDIPLPADYDGDGDTDIAIYQPSTGLWAIRGQNWANFGGAPGDIPLPLRPALHSHFGL